MSSQSDQRLAIYLPTLVGGGAERVMLNLAIEFVKRGYSVEFVLAQNEGAFMAEYPREVKLITLNPFPMKFGRSVFSIPRLVQYLRRNRPTVLLTGLHANIISIWAKKFAGIPLRVVITEHNTLSMQRFTQTFLYHHLLTWLIRLNYLSADRIVAVSQGVAEDLAKIGRIPREKISVIANPIITPALIAGAREHPAHPWFNPGEPPVILAVGRLTTQKDFPLLIKAFAQVRSTLAARLMILGDGPDREKLIQLVRQYELEKDVSLPGFVHNPYPYMTRAAIFVLSSLWEGLPTVLVEALYCGTPVVATDCPSGPREILENGKYGTLVPVGDAQRLAQAMLDALKTGKTQVSENSWKPYTVDHVVDSYLNLLFTH